MPNNLLIEQLRHGRNAVSEDIPYHFLHEQEPGLDDSLQEVNTIFLTGKECAFKCLMCDLWKNTLTTPTKPGAILRQLDYALERLPKASVIKLYNSSNFFDPKAVPPEDYDGIIERVQHYSRIIVENHPKLTGKACIAFAEKLTGGTLEVAMGLETIHPFAISKLNKQMVPDDFKKAATFLRSNNISVRAFVLLNPPYLIDSRENIEWAFKTVQFAFDSGAQRCTIIPVRTGNGIMELLEQQGNYVPPTLDMLEEVFERSLALQQGQVFADTWDIGFISQCPQCFEERKNRLELMNIKQKIQNKVVCNCHTPHG